MKEDNKSKRRARKSIAFTDKRERIRSELHQDIQTVFRGRRMTSSEDVLEWSERGSRVTIDEDALLMSDSDKMINRLRINELDAFKRIKGRAILVCLELMPRNRGQKDKYHHHDNT